MLAPPEVVKRITDLLAHLLKKEVSEFAFASGRLPCVKIANAYEPVDDRSLTRDEVYGVLMSLGGSRYVETLTDKPTKWRARVDGVGSLLVGAVVRGERVQARVLLTRAEEKPRATSMDRDRGPPSDALMAAIVDGSRDQIHEPFESDAPPAFRSDPGGLLELDDDPLEHTMPLRIPDAVLAARADVELDRVAARQAPPMSRNLESKESPRSAAPPVERELRDLESRVPAASPMLAPSLSPRVLPSALVQALAFARKHRASDLHVVAGRPLLARLSQELTPHGPILTPEVVSALVMPLVPARCREPFERDGTCDFALETETEGRFRVNVVRHRGGIKATFRLIATEVPTLRSLGLPNEIAQAITHHQGLIVATGPTGHGKTSTVAALVNLLNCETTHHVITVEDPIEYIHPRKKAMLSQREVGTHTKSFQTALKASLREDPDVIVVGELRDAETVRMALAAAETGHLVLGTMNTPSAAKTIDRLIDLFPTGEQAQVRLTLASALRLVVSQRLLPAREGEGLIAAVEMLPGSFALASLIRENKTFQIPSLQQRGKAFGIVRLDDSLTELIIRGSISIEGALLVAESPDDLLSKIGQRGRTP